MQHIYVTCLYCYQFPSSKIVCFKNRLQDPVFVINEDVMKNTTLFDLGVGSKFPMSNSCKVVPSRQGIVIEAYAIGTRNSQHSNLALITSVLSLI